MVSVPEADILAVDAEVTIVVADARVQVELTAADWAQLRAALETDPHSRLAADVLAKRQSDCDRLTAEARAITRDRFDSAPLEAHEAWVAAKDGCETLWTAELESERAAVEARVEARRCDEELAAASSSIDAETSLDAISPLAARLVEIKASCTSAPNVSSEHEIEARLVSAEKRIRAEQDKEARRIAREEAQQRFQEQRQQEREAARQRSRDGAMLLCNDGSLSPTCTCGRDSYRGCCSYHGGVNRCSAD